VEPGLEHLIPSTKESWKASSLAARRVQPDQLSLAQLGALSPQARSAYDRLRRVWHANLGPFETPQLVKLRNELSLIVDSNEDDFDKPKADRAHINEDWLREQYLVLGRTQADIAAELGCCYPHAARSLKRLGIPTRARQRNLDPPAGSPAILAPALRRLEGPDRLRLFELTMRHDSVREAAAELGVTESALGQRLRLLEREFGQPLFIRAFSGPNGRHQATMFGREVLEALREVPPDSKDLRRVWRPGRKLVDHGACITLTCDTGTREAATDYSTPRSAHDGAENLLQSCRAVGVVRSHWTWRFLAGSRPLARWPVGACGLSPLLSTMSLVRVGSVSPDLVILIRSVALPLWVMIRGSSPATRQTYNPSTVGRSRSALRG
jgi:hypothetical protein